MKTFLWIEDRKDKSGYIFWKIFMEQLCPDVVVESKKNNSELVKAVKALEDNEVSDKDSVEIGNENVPLAIDKEEHHNCIIHWIILILTIIAGVYNLVRAIMRSQNDEEDNVDKDDVKMYQEV